MNLRELKDRVFQQTGGAYRDQEHMRVLLNEAIIAMATEAKLHASVPIVTVIGTAYYPLPADFKEPVALIEGTYDNPFREYALVDPRERLGGYAIDGDQLIIKPTPSYTKTLEFHYYAYPAEMVEEMDVLPIDSRYAQVVAAYASANILSLPTMTEVANQGTIDRYWSIWDEGMARFKRDLQRRNKRATVRKVVTWW